MPLKTCGDAVDWIPPVSPRSVDSNSSYNSLMSEHDMRGNAIAEKRAVLNILERRVKEKQSARSNLHEIESDIYAVEDKLQTFHVDTWRLLDCVEKETRARLSLPNKKGRSKEGKRLVERPEISFSEWGKTSTNGSRIGIGESGDIMNSEEPTISCSDLSLLSEHSVQTQPYLSANEYTSQSFAGSEIGRSDKEDAMSCSDILALADKALFNSERSPARSSSDYSSFASARSTIAQVEIRDIADRLTGVEKSLSRIESLVGGNDPHCHPCQSSHAGISEVSFFYDHAIDGLEKALEPLVTLRLMPLLHSKSRKGIRTDEDLLAHITAIRSLISKLSYSKAFYAGRVASPH